MRLTVKNLGPISKASVNLGKDLIILTGENNTGKTYLASTIYELFSPYWIDEKNVVQWAYQKDGPKLSTNFEEWDFNIVAKFEEIISHSLKFSLPMKFVVDGNFFQKMEISVSCAESDEIARKLREMRISETAIKETEPGSAIVGYRATINKEKDKLNCKIQAEASTNIIFPNKGIEIHFLAPKFRELLYQIKPTIFITAERTGIALFHKELSVIKNKIFDSLLTNGKAQEMIEFVGKRFNKYPRPIKDALETAQNLDAFQKQKSEADYLADKLEKEFLQGEISITENGDLVFTPQGSKNSLEAHMTSSTVKSLAPLSFYLRHTAKKGDFIIIDEPELNLHPNNQVKIARFIAHLVNEGFKVMISTHSDYILRELNSLIMLGCGMKKRAKATQELMKKYGYTEAQALSKEQVGVYMFRQGKDVEEVIVEDTGFEIATIDETVDKLNETSQNIYYELFD
jgi:predicted ATP-dependent endonuclease of OLD family